MGQKSLSEVKFGEVFALLNNDPSEYTLVGSIMPTKAGYAQGGNELLDQILALNRVLQRNPSLQMIASSNGSVKIADKSELVTTSLQ
jgi:hypothetical protein